LPDDYKNNLYFSLDECAISQYPVQFTGVPDVGTTGAWATDSDMLGKHSSDSADAANPVDSIARSCREKLLKLRDMTYMLQDEMPLQEDTINVMKGKLASEHGLALESRKKSAKKVLKAAVKSRSRGKLRELPIRRREKNMRNRERKKIG